jgi:hypothetical protein
LRGVGPTIAAVLHNEVFYRRFANRREVAAYCGLDPTPFASGDTRREHGISKAGNRRARHAAVELAWLGLHGQPDTALSCWLRTRLGAARGRHKPIMIVALARKLVIASCSSQGQASGDLSKPASSRTAPSSKRNRGPAAHRPTRRHRQGCRVIVSPPGSTTAKHRDPDTLGLPACAIGVAAATGRTG